ncbi:MAG: hypothetical protein JXR53_13210 [Bacteroidales bacterium]|nr:hypothetical protein [Bacteroidales bacterium]
MKQIIFSLLAFAFVAVSAQSNKIGINSQYHETDTTQTFSLSYKNKDKCIEKLIIGIGTPKTQTTGKIVWNSVIIPGIDEKVQIELMDGIFEIKESSAIFSPFLNEADKTKKLQELSSTKIRIIEITLLDQNGDNFVNTKAETYLITTYLTGILEGVE